MTKIAGVRVCGFYDETPAPAAQVSAARRRDPDQPSSVGA